MAATATRKNLLRVITSWPIGAVLAGVTLLDEQDAPPHFVSPNASAAFGAYSALALVQKLSPPSWPGIAAHSLNLGVQGLKLATSLSETAPKLAEGQKRTRVVVLGSGWGAISFIRNLSAAAAGPGGWYDLTVVSPRSYFLYTPLLPGAVTGTVETKSIVESVRALLRGKGLYYEAQVYEVDPVRKVVKCRYSKPFKGAEIAKEFEVPYDVLVFGVGAINNTFNIPGVSEHCYFLKEMEDAVALRRRVHECIELAALPDTPPDVRKRLRTFVVVGGGPTGVETAAELHDMVKEDLRRYMPETAADIEIKIIETRDHVLSMYDKQISEYTEKHFQRSGIDLLLNKMVQKVDDTGLHVKNANGESEFVPASTVVWCTGIKLNPLAVQLMGKLPKDSQQNARAIKTDAFLRVKGAGGSMFALGDTATIEADKVMERAAALFEEGDTDKNGVLSCSELRALMKRASLKYPQLALYEEYFQCRGQQGLLAKLGVGSQASVDDDIQITPEQFAEKLAAVDKTLRALPATAQVANQEGRYLGELFSRFHVQSDASAAAAADAPSAAPAPPGAGLPDEAPAFKYKHLGSFAYVGADKAVMEMAVKGTTPNVFTGWLTGLAWKGLESWMQISARNKYLVSRDWVKAKIFGRDISDV